MASKKTGRALRDFLPAIIPGRGRTRRFREHSTTSGVLLTVEEAREISTCLRMSEHWELGEKLNALLEEETMYEFIDIKSRFAEQQVNEFLSNHPTARLVTIVPKSTGYWKAVFEFPKEQNVVVDLQGGKRK